jgi:hypothetical protein
VSPPPQPATSARAIAINEQALRLSIIVPEFPADMSLYRKLRRFGRDGCPNTMRVYEGRRECFGFLCRHGRFPVFERSLDGLEQRGGVEVAYRCPKSVVRGESQSSSAEVRL